MDRRSFGGNIWRMVYPLLIYYVLAWGIGYLALCTVVMKDTWSVFANLPVDATYMQIQEMLEPYMSSEAMLHYQQVYLKYYSLVQMVIDGCMLPIACVLFWMDRKQDSKEWHSSRQGLHWYMLPVIAGFALCVFGNLLISVFSQPTVGGSINDALVNALVDTNGVGALEQIQNSGLFQVLVLCILTPVVEELLFRGILYKRIREWRGVFVALAWSAMIYAINYGTADQIIYAVLVSIGAGYLYERFRNIMAPIIFHCGLNLTAIILENNLERVNQLLGSDFRVGVCLIFCGIMLAVIYILVRYYITIEEDKDSETIDNNSTII